MAPMLQMVIAVVLAVLCACLVPLLLQLKRTAAAVERLADSAREDLGRLAQDVHQVRQQLDGLADLAGSALAVPATLGDWLSRFLQGLAEPGERRGSGWLGLVLAGFKVFLNIILRPKEATHE